MAEIIKKVASLFNNSKTRILAIIVLLLIFMGMIWGISAIISYMKGPLGPVTAASVSGGPNIESVPGGWDNPVSPEYARQVRQRNVEAAEQAKKTGSSAMPTIIASTSNVDSVDPTKASGGVGFSELKKLENVNPEEIKSLTFKCKNVGNLVFDSQGKTVGTVAANAEVKDPCGRTFGKIDDNCNIRDVNGKIIGRAGTLPLGAAVYDPQGRLVGTVGPDGQVRDLAGNIVANVDANGVVRDLNGQVLPTAELGSKGTLVYDESGNVLGVAGADGKVRDASGKVIGTFGRDGLVKALNGEILGKAGNVQANALVYDKNGKLLGTVGSDGKVRDASGKVVGVVGSDGNVRNPKGELIGKAATTAIGASVYDSSGRLIGTAGPDGFVRDDKGNVIGSVGPDGVARNTKGEIIGKAGSPSPGGLVYDDKGKLIGKTSADGSIRDAKGNIVGKIETTTLAKPVATKSPAIPTGVPVYDKNGKLIGMVGSDGSVKDAQGNVLGTVGADGLLRNAAGQIVGKAGTVPPGTNVYDENGNPIGTVGSDGIVRDAAGNAVGMYDPASGNFIDKQGRVVGKSFNKLSQRTDPLAGLSAADKQKNVSAQLVLAKQRQDDLLAKQQLDINKQQIQAGMTSQLGQLFASWAPPSQQYVAGAVAEGGGQAANLVQGTSLAANTLQGGVAASKVLIKAGTVMFAVLNTAVNTDQPGPIMASIVNGPFKGAKLMGTVQRQTDKAMLTFNVMNADKFPKTIAINAVAIDPDTARTALASSVDNHYLLRYGTLFASSFVQGYATALTTSGASVTSLGLGLAIVKNNPDLSSKGKNLVALGKVGEQYANVLTPLFDTPPTVKVNSGTGVGILFLSDVANL